MKKLLLFSFLITTFSIYSQTLDSTFGNNGVVTNQYSTTSSTDITYAAAMQSDGKMIYVGREVFTNNAFVSRVNTTGQLDSSFNNYGFRKFNATGFDSVLVQADGKIVVSGTNSIYRLNSDGSVDTTFNLTGGLFLTINSQNFFSKSIVEQSNGKILVSGYVNNGSNNDFAIIRLNSDGSYDNTFDTDGKALFPIGATNDESFGMALQLDGKIILTGQTNNGSNYDFATIRINNNGSIDTSFANLGKAIVQFSGQDYGRSIDIQANGKILIVGVGTTGKLYVIRYNIDGTLDTTFDSDGILPSTINLSTSTSVFSPSPNRPKIKSLNTGKILISGTSNTNFALIQLNSNGSLDTTFGTNGSLEQNILSNDTSSFLFITANNKIVTGGGSNDGISIYRMQKLEFSINGVFENSSSYNLILGNDNFTRMFEQSNGKVITLLESTEGQSLRRYNVNGMLDTTFGTNGVIPNIPNTPYKIKNQNDKIILNCIDIPTITRYNSNGNLDTTFGVNGTVNFSLNTPNYVSFIDDIYYDATNGFIYVGFDYDDSVDIPNQFSFSYGILRLNNTGVVDTSFGVNGIAKIRFNYYGITSNEYPAEIGIQSDGKIIVSGFLNSITGTQDSVLGTTRFNSNGTLDTTFGINGKVTTQINTNNFPRQMFVLSDNKFILNFGNISNGVSQTTSIKYNNNGTLDSTFGTNGIVNDGNYNFDMILQPDGKIVKAGNINSQFGIKRYNSNGTIDTSFGTNGIVNTPINFNSSINEILFLQDGKLLAGGSSFNGTNTLATFAKYTDITLGNLDFTENKNSILIYPNPIQSEATFTYNLVNDETVSIDIIDLQGKIVQSILQNKFQIEGSYNQTITLSNSLAAGNYILKFSSSTGSQSVKIIKKD